jgi:molybdenum cofactor guanylyltransferase
MSKAAETKPLAAIVLSGGAGTRVGGEDKGWLAWRGVPLAIRAVSRLTDDGVGEILVSANRNFDRYAALDREAAVVHHAARRVRVVGDAEPGYLGPIAGLAAALAVVEAETAVTVPVDVPDWPDGLVFALADALAETNARCVVAHDGVHRQPLFAAYRVAACIDRVADALRGRRLSVRALQDALGARERQFGVPADYVNLNELDRYQ